MGAHGDPGRQDPPPSEHREGRSEPVPPRSRADRRAGAQLLMADRLTGPSMLALVGRERTGPDLWRVLQPITALEKAGYPCGWDFKENALIGQIAPVFDGY